MGITKLLCSMEINEILVRKFVHEARPKDEAVRALLDVGYSYTPPIIEIFELRPEFKNPENILKLPFAKIRYYKLQNVWKLYWMRASGRWELYEPHPQDTYLDNILEIIKTDAYGCFRG